MNKGIEKILETKGIFIAQKNISGKCVFIPRTWSTVCWNV